MVRNFYMSCIVNVALGDSIKCSGFIKIDSSQVRTEEDLVKSIQKKFDIGVIQQRQVSISQSIGKQTSAPRTQSFSEPEYQKATINMKCMCDITGDPSGMYFVQFDATCRDGKYRTHNAMIYLDWSALNTQSELKERIMGQFALGEGNTVSVHRIDQQRGCFITSMTKIS